MKEHHENQKNPKMGLHTKSRSKVACFEKICQRNNKVEESTKFYFEKVKDVDNRNNVMKTPNLGDKSKIKDE